MESFPCINWCQFCRFCERAQALIHGDLHTSSVMVTRDSTQVIDPEFGFYGPMGYDIGAFVGNLILAFFAQDGHADPQNDRKVSSGYSFSLIYLVVFRCLFCKDVLFASF